MQSIPYWPLNGPSFLCLRSPEQAFFPHPLGTTSASGPGGPFRPVGELSCFGRILP